jgi:pimeloyl-ACP methyl ester carboxylesterase
MQNRKPNHPPAPATSSHHPAKHVHEVVDPRWIISALAGMILLAILCAYAVVCVLFYRGQWQLVLQPSHAVNQTPASAGLQAEEVHFGVDASGQPQLDGWWIPADTTGRPTALLLHGAAGSLSNAIPTAQLLHNAELNVLLFDYRGFGHSLGQHPSQSLMQADAASALRYLTTIRNVPASSIVVFGEGVGASLAVNLCAAHKEIPAVILESPQGDFDRTVRSDPRAQLAPVKLLFNQTFPLAAPLKNLPTPKLLISLTPGTTPLNLQSAADPKSTLELPPSADPQILHGALQRFLGAYLPQQPESLTPKP